MKDMLCLMYNNEKKKTYNHLASIFDLPRRNGNMIGKRLVFYFSLPPLFSTSVPPLSPTPALGRFFFFVLHHPRWHSRVPAPLNCFINLLIFDLKYIIH